MTGGIGWMSLVPGSGYGDASRAYLAGLRAAGVPVTWTPLGWVPVPPGSALGPLARVRPDELEHGDLVGHPVPHDTVVVHAPPLWHDWLAREAGGRRLVAYTTWETDRLPTEWVAILNRFDAVLVPSQFNRTVLAASGVDRPVTVVPHILRHPGSGDRGEVSKGGRPGPYTFYVLATWSTRKAIPDLVEAFVRAFGAADDVRLVLQTGPVDLVAARAAATASAPGGRAWATATWRCLAQMLAGRRDLPEIVLRTDRLDEEGVSALHAEGDCFVLLSRGEGWGLGAFDASAAGNPVIITGWGGGPEHLPAGYPYLVEHDLVPATDDPPDLWFGPRPGERWARARVDHAVELLRQVHAGRDEAAAWGRRAQGHVQARYRPEQVTRQLLAALE